MTDSNSVVVFKKKKKVLCLVLFITLQVFPFRRYSAVALLQVESSCSAVFGELFMLCSIFMDVNIPLPVLLLSVLYTMVTENTSELSCHSFVCLLYKSVLKCVGLNLNIRFIVYIKLHMCFKMLNGRAGE